MYNTDSFFTIGSTHKVCEDYSSNGVINGVYYAIVSDGCSSSKNTDIGARLLTLCATQVIRENGICFNVGNFEELLLGKLRSSMLLLNLPSTVFDATLIVAMATESMGVVYSWGDGVISIDGIHHDIQYSSNAPYYLSYKLDPNRDAAYEKQLCQGFTKSIGEIRTPIALYAEYPQKIVVMSDGIQQFFKGNDIVDMVDEAVSFPSIRGVFLQKKLNLLKRFLVTNGIHHKDDFSMAAIVRSNNESSN